MYSAATAFDLKAHSPIITSQPINLLLLDDSTFDRQRIRRMCRETGLPIYLDEVGSIGALQAMLDIDQFDLVMLDYRLAEGDGLAALDLVRNHPVNANVPTIMVTGSDDPALPVRAMRRGCQDMLLKAEMTAASLKAAVEAAIENSASLQGTPLRRREAMQTLSRSAISEVRQALQPELASLVREVRGLRAAVDLPGVDLAAELERLEHRCVTLWSALNQMGETRRS